MTGSAVRWPAIAGIAFALLLIVGLVLIADIPDADASDQEMIDYLNDDGNLWRNIGGFYLWGVAAMMFLWFAAGLRTVLRGGEGESSTLSTLGFGSAAVFTAMLMAAGAAVACVAGAVQFGQSSNPAPDFVRMFPQLGFAFLLIGGGFAAIALILTTSILTLRTSSLPQWTAWVGFLAAIALLFGAFFIPMIALPIWVVAVSVAMLMEGSRTQGARA
jgi:hypothetical protein